MRATADLRPAKRLARANGIAWSDVRDAVVIIREEARAACQHENEIRRRAWEKMVTPGSHPFWRHGFFVRWPRAFADGDRTLIPGFDVVADGLKYEFPELDGDCDPAETLYDLLRRPYRRFPSALALCLQAIERVAAAVTSALEPSCDSEPF